METMSRFNVVGLALVLLPLWAGDSLGAGVNWWHDPQRGCGTLDGWQRTFRIADLPGCDGDLPKQAPQGEQSMHDAKKALREAEKILDSGQTTDVEIKLDLATTTMNKAPNDPRVNWARPHYQTALTILRKRLVITPKLPKLRTVYKKAIDAAEAYNKQKTPASRKNAVEAADACVAEFRDVEAAGADLSLPVELNPGKPRPLRDDMRDCAAGKNDGSGDATKPDAVKPDAPKPDAAKPDAVKPDAAKPDAAKPDAAKPEPAKGGNDGGVPRAKWLKTLKGDRKKVFQDHGDAFPEFEGDPGPKGAAKAAEWTYGGEVFKFKRNKLVKPKGEK